MNYERIYNELISSRIILNRKKDDENYFENHHIIPKSLGGSNEKMNLVLLTHREHFLAHKLLVCVYSKNPKEKYKMVCALWFMTHIRSKHSNISVTCSREYEKVKKIFINKKVPKEVIEKAVATRKANNNYIAWNKGQVGYKFSKEIIDKRTETRKKGMWNPNGKSLLSDETKQKISNAMLGRKPSLTTIEAVIKAQSKVVLQFDITDAFIKEWSSIKIASKELKITGIGATCNGKQKTSGGFIWRFK